MREGRTVYDNIKKGISFTLPTSAGEAMTIVVAPLLGMTLPITPVQILWVNLITGSPSSRPRRARWTGRRARAMSRC